MVLRSETSLERNIFSDNQNKLCAHFETIAHIHGKCKDLCLRIMQFGKSCRDTDIDVVS